jgi:hypothetical protein
VCIDRAAAGRKSGSRTCTASTSRSCATRGARRRAIAALRRVAAWWRDRDDHPFAAFALTGDVVGGIRARGATEFGVEFTLAALGLLELDIARPADIDDPRWTREDRAA